MDNLPVIFRKEPGDGSILAVFPTIAESYSGYHMLCYAHVGQHGTCSLDYYRETKPASEEESADLYRELRGIYESDHYGEPVKLVPAKRRSAAMQSEFLRQARVIGSM